MNDLLLQFDRLVADARVSLQTARQRAMFSPDIESDRTAVEVFEAVLAERESARDAIRMEVEWRASHGEAADADRLAWLESLMRPREGYVEVYLAGLRNGDAEATAFQVELQDRPAMGGPTLRAAIDAARAAWPTDAKG